MQKNITSLPWRHEIIGLSSAGLEGVDVCQITNGHNTVAEHLFERDAAFIVKACNSHDELVDKLRGMIELAEQINDASDLGGLLDERHDAAVALLAKLEAK